MKSILFLFFFLFCFNIKSQNLGHNVQVDTMALAPDFSIIDTDGNLLNLYSYLDSGNVVVLDFFTTTCGPCSYYAPVIEYFYQHNGAGNGLVKLWGIEVYSTNDDVINYKIANGITNPCASGIDGGGQLVFQNYNNLYGYHGTPTYAVIAPSRKVYWNVNYPPTKNGFDEYISSSLPNTSVTNTINQGCDFIVYPNPAKEFINIEFNKSIPQNIKLELINQLGMRVYEFTNRKNLTANILKVNIDSLPKGIYVLKITADNNFKTVEKIFIQK